MDTHASVCAGKKLQNNRVTHWEASYIDYSRLKRLIGAPGSAFADALASELADAERFYRDKLAEFASQLELFDEHRRRHARTLHSSALLYARRSHNHAPPRHYSTTTALRHHHAYYHHLHWRPFGSY